MSKGPFKMKYKNLKEVIEQLQDAVKAHGKQAKVIQSHINKMEEKSPLEKKGLWHNIHAKRKRIKAGSNEKMRTPGSEGAPSAKDFKDSQ
tara:strand:- start:215 stop:484 length:270 start_codon:yes stop_codon:yes gene_type:complete